MTSDRKPLTGLTDAVADFGTLLLLVSVTVAPWFFGAAADSARYTVASVVLLASGFATVPMARRRETPRALPWALALPCLALVQCVFRTTVSPLRSLEAALVALAFAAAWMVLDAKAGGENTRMGRLLAWSVALVCVANAGFAAFQWSRNPRSLFGGRSDLQTMPFGSYVNHNNFAGLMLLGLFTILGIALGDIRRSGRMTALGLSLLAAATSLGIAVAASGSRGGVLSLCFGLLFFGRSLRTPRSRQDQRGSPIALFLALFVALLAVSWWAAPQSTRSRLATVGGASTAYRLEMVRAAAVATSQAPFLGGGLGAFGDFVSPWKQGYGDVRSERAEADAVEILAETGLVGFALLISFARFLMRSVHISDRGRSQAWLRRGAWVACVTMLFHSLFDFGFRLPANALAFAILLGVATAPPENAARKSRFAAMVPTLLTIMAFIAGYRAIGASQEAIALKNATAERKLTALEPVIARHPYLDEARRQRGLAWLALAYSQGQYDGVRLKRAADDLDTVLKARPNWGVAWADRAWVSYFQGDVRGAENQFARASELDPTHVGVGVSRAQFWSFLGKIPEAVTEVQRLRAVNPSWSRSSAQQLVASWTQDKTLIATIR